MLAALQWHPGDDLWVRKVAAHSGLTLYADRSVGLAGNCAGSSHSVFILWGTVNLQNNSELCSVLHLPDATPDEQVVTAAYRKWREDTPDFLRGSFAFVIWDGVRSELYGCRDHLGTSALYYWSAGARFACASDPQILAHTPEIPRQLNRRKLAAMAVPGGHHVRDEETFYQGIMSLHPGAWLRSDASGLTRKIYWSPRVLPGLVPRRPSDAFAMLRELLFKSVRNCLKDRQSPAVLLSGGLDSSAVTAIALRCLAEQNRSLTALSVVLPEKERDTFSDEREFIDEFRSAPNLEIEFVTGEGTGPFDWMDNDPSRCESSFLFTCNYNLFDEFGRAATRRNLDLMMTGNHGEIGATGYARGFYLEEFTRFRWISLAQNLHAVHTRTGISHWRPLASEFRDLIFPHLRLIPLILLSRDLIAECDVPAYRLPRTTDHRARQMELLGYTLGQHALRPDQFVGRAPVRYPLYDKDIVEFCLAAPGDLKIRDGYSRYLIRGALEGILPEKIRLRLDKKPFCSNYSVGYNSQLPKARAFVESIGVHDPVRSVVDIDALKAIMKPLAAAKPTLHALVQVPATIQLIFFLRQFSDFRP